MFNLNETAGKQFVLFLHENVNIVLNASFLTRAGVRLELHEPGTLPFTSPRSLALPPGAAHLVHFRIQSVHRLPAPYVDCGDTPAPLHLAGAGANFSYTYTACISQCVSEAILTKCACVDGTSVTPWFRPNASHPFCGDIKVRPVETLERLWRCSRAVRAESVAPCARGCPTTCRHVGYETTLSSALWPTESFVTSFYETMIANRDFRDDFDEYLATNTTSLTAAIRDNAVRVSVELGSLRQEVLRDAAQFSVDGVLSRMGAILNMWCGVTVVFVVELVELLGSCVLNARTKKNDASVLPV